VFITVTDRDKPAATQLAAALGDLGFRLYATAGTAQAIRRVGVPVERVAKIQDGSPNVVDLIESGEVRLVINTPTGSGARADGYEIRTAAVRHGVPCITTLSGILAAIQGIEALRAGAVGVRSLQEFHAEAGAGQGEGERQRAGGRGLEGEGERQRAGGRGSST
jgi:carbamoyl-phosphate synthase large subunit